MVVEIKNKMATAYIESSRAAYKFLGMPFGAKQEEIYEQEFYDRLKTKKYSVKRGRVAESVFRFRRIKKGEN